MIWTCGASDKDEDCASGSLSDSLGTVVKLICGCAESEEGSPGTVGGWEIVIIEEVDAGLFDGDVSDHLCSRLVLYVGNVNSERYYVIMMKGSLTFRSERLQRMERQRRGYLCVPCCNEEYVSERVK